MTRGLPICSMLLLASLALGGPPVARAQDLEYQAPDVPDIQEDELSDWVSKCPSLMEAFTSCAWIGVCLPPPSCSCYRCSASTCCYAF